MNEHSTIEALQANNTVLTTENVREDVYDINQDVVQMFEIAEAEAQQQGEVERVRVSSQRLLAEQKFGGDSTQMQMVKRSVSDLEQLLAEERENVGTVQYVESLLGVYKVAITACKYYCDTKHPSFGTGIQRKKVVNETLENLMEEEKQLVIVKELIDKERVEAATLQQLRNGKDLILLARNYGSGEIAEHQKQDEKDIRDLTFEEFTEMIGTHNRGQVVFDKGGLKIINNGVLSKSKGEVSTSNMRVRLRLFALAKQKLGEQVDTATHCHLLNLLGIENMSEIEMLPLSREMIHAVVSFVNEKSSEVAKQLKQGEKQETYKVTNEYQIAETVNTLVGVSSFAHIQANVKEEEVLKAQILDIFNVAKRNGLKLPELTKHQMNNLVRGNIGRVRDNIYNSIHKVYRGMAHLNSGRVTDISVLLNNEAIIANIAALTIYNIASVSMEGKTASTYYLESYIKKVAFEKAAVALAPDLAAGVLQLENFEYINVGMLAATGSSGLDIAVESHIPKCEKWQNDKEKLGRGVNGFTDLCDWFEELIALREQGFTQGLTTEQANRMKDLGRNIGRLMRNVKRLEDIEFVVSELTGTRFAEGFKRVKELAGESEVFEARTNRFAEALTCNGLHGESEEQHVEVEKIKEFSGEDQELVAYLDHLDTDARKIASILMMRQSASSFIQDKNSEESKELVNGIRELYEKIRAFTEGEAGIADVKIGKNNIRILHRESNILDLIIDGNRISLPYTAELLADRMEIDMAANTELYGNDRILRIIERINVKDGTIADFFRGRNIFTKCLVSKTGLESKFFDNVPVGILKSYAIMLLTGYINKDQIKADVEGIENIQKINVEEALELLGKMEQQRAEVTEKVTIVRVERVQTEQESWTAEEAMVKEFLSDLVYSKHTWDADQTLDKPGERLKRMMTDNIDAIIILMKRPELLERMAGKMPLPEVEGRSMKDIITEGVNSLLRVEEYQIARAVVGDTMDDVAKATILATLQTDAALEVLREMDQEIDMAIKDSMEQFQKLIANSIDSIFEVEAEQQEGQQVEQQAEQQQQGAVQAEQPIDTSQQLDEILKSVAKGEKGQGKFTRLVLKKYFKSVSRLDQRSMIASAMRNIKPVEEPVEGATEVEIEERKRQQMAGFLSGMLKGAGPLMQKMLQGIPTEGVSAELKEALKDMKSNLAPIPDEIVKEQMWSIVERSKGNITRIEVTRVLGAASVGQAFLCKIYGPNIPEEGKNVVVKLLRPDVRNRMEREKQVMLRCAQQTDENGGMYATYLGQLQRIEEELDLTIEAANVEEGSVYDGHVQTVKAMKLNTLVAPTSNAMVLEQAKGETVDKYLDRIHREYTEMMQLIYQTEQGEAAFDVKNMEVKQSNMVDFIQVRHKMGTLLAQLQKRQKHLTELCKIWVTEGVFGKGFYHGDLHAGNMIINDDELTAIDFGNATKLNETQQLHITRVVAATAAGEKAVDLFMDGFKNLLENTDMERYESKKEQLKEAFTEVLRLGTAKDAGKRIAAALIKAQEIGIELPAAIHNFSQSQIRLENTVNEMNSMIIAMQKQMQAMENVLKAEKSYDECRVDQYYQMVGKENTSKVEALYLPKKDEVMACLASTQQEEIDKIDKEMRANKEILLKPIKQSVSYLNKFSTLESDEKRQLIDHLRVVKRIMEYLFPLGDTQEEMNSLEQIPTTKVGGMGATVVEPLKEILGKCSSKIEGFFLTYTNYMDQKKKQTVSAEELETMKQEAYKVYDGFEYAKQYFNKPLHGVQNAVEYYSSETLRNEFQRMFADEEYGALLSVKFDEYYNSKNDIKTLQTELENAKQALENVANAEDVKQLERLQELHKVAGGDLDLLKEQEEKVQKLYRERENAVKTSERLLLDKKREELIKQKEFIEVYRKLFEKDMRATEGIINVEFDNSEPDIFMYLMGDVIGQNFSASIKRLGILTSLKYGLYGLEI